MKRSISLMLAMLLLLSLTSCAGIGDDTGVGSLGVAESEPDIEIGGEYRLHKDNQTSFMSGKMSVELRDKFLSDIENNEPRQYETHDDKGSYYVVWFDQPEGEVRFRVYSDGCIYKIKINSEIIEYLGARGENFYNKLKVSSYSPSYESDLAAANFTLDDILIVTSREDELRASDFPEIDCLETDCLMELDKTGGAIWLLKLYCDNEEKLMEAIEKLNARSDISSAEPNYRMTLID